ncbi:MAG TPA: endonuclease/exonuclease/phosphatase family protein, partial [Anaerolineales bacterium]|nr:endonuclease/exonuclease/phosphatase family protein [Anaerolineales bacterium]
LPFHTPLPDKQNPEVALFSRYPILEAEQLNLPFSDRSWKTIVDLGEVNINVIVLHLTPTRAEEVPMSQWTTRITERQIVRMEQVERVIESVRNSPEPDLVLCDCNFTEFSDAYARLDEFLDDGFARAGWGFGHTIHPVGIDIRLQRVDYVWYSSGFNAISAKVIKDGKSDHNPLVVELDLLLE